MNRRQFMQSLLAGGMAMGIPATLRSAALPRAPRPNLLFVFPDQWRGQALGFLGEEPVLTPHLDRFAAQSLVLTRNQIKNYFAMMTGVDEQFGRILKALTEQKLEDNTIVVFTSDHGNCLGCHEETAKNVHYQA